ncbi:putative polyamine transport protein specific for spermine [Acaromyces ingoldii]|uniref:Putative polyamine transport protein specific for spermine n=1 Tax=Acaromyces ingoldii TaxID=215250 RepID=A0A316YEN2_9BASI|nr:putative polyamine transport protein specific for spermine [Acaromyces ingoldii]PWN88030.1 putative polyamine transport protein specific for spermine [Acaromyces ingoldii]
MADHLHTAAIDGRSSTDNGHTEPVHEQDRADADEKRVEHAQENPFLVTFAAHDRDDPRNLSTMHKWLITAFSGFLCFAVAFGSSMPTGDLPGAADSLHVGSVAINLSITLFVVGFGVGPMVFAPLSELIGRWPVYCIATLLYFLFTLPCALADNLATLLAARTIAGIAASAPMTNVGGTLSDIWAPHEKGLPLAIFSALIFVGPVLGPVVGGWIAVGVGEDDGWRVIYWTLFALCGVAFAMTLFTRETLASTILAKRAAKLRKQTGDQRFTSGPRPSLGQMVTSSLTRPFQMLFTEPILIFFSAYLSLVYSLLYLTFFAFPIVFQGLHGFNAGETGLTFLSLLVGICLAMLYVWFVQERMYHRRRNARGSALPEDRLPLMFVGSVLLPVSLFIFAWTSLKSVHWSGPLVAGIPLGFSFVAIYISANSYIVDCYPSVAASALAAKTLARSLCGAAVPLYVEQMYKAMHPQWASTLLALVSLAMVPIPFFFYRYGPLYRRRSALAESSDVVDKLDP